MIYAFFEPLFVGAIGIILFAIIISELIGLVDHIVKWIGGDE